MGLFSNLLKEVIIALVNDTDSANSQKNQKNSQSENLTEYDSFQRDHARYCKWCEILNKETRRKTIVDYLLTLNDFSFRVLVANLEQMKTNVISHIQEHNENEKYAWGSYLEDQLAYQSAKIRTGASDPKWLAQLEDYKQSLETVSWTIYVCNSHWESNKV